MEYTGCGGKGLWVIWYLAYLEIDSDVKMERAKELLRQRELRFKDRVDGAAAGAKNKQTKAKSYEIGENSNLQVWIEFISFFFIVLCFYFTHFVI